MSLFKDAKAIASPKKPAAKPEKKEIPIKDLQKVAEIDVLIKALTTVKATFETSVKEQALCSFVEQAEELKKRPDNFRGIDGNASASIEIRKRSSTSALTEDEQKVLIDQGLKIEKIVSVQKFFAINPAYASNEALLEKVSKAISKIVPNDFIMVQEEQSKMVVTDETIEEAFKKGASRGLIEIITTFAVKPKLNSVDMKVILKNIKALLESK